jgi:hypothetical protein
MSHRGTKALFGSHQWIDAANLKMSLAIADKLRTQPHLMGVARRNVKRWKNKLRPCPKALREWDQILRTCSINKILDLLTQPNEEGQRLRQSDPFVGILSDEERLSFLGLNEKS